MYLIMSARMLNVRAITGIIGFELYFPVTVEIVILTVILTFVIGVPLGTYIGRSGENLETEKKSRLQRIN